METVRLVRIQSGKAPGGGLGQPLVLIKHTNLFDRAIGMFLIALLLAMDQVFWDVWGS